MCDDDMCFIYPFRVSPVLCWIFIFCLILIVHFQLGPCPLSNNKIEINFWTLLSDPFPHEMLWFPIIDWNEIINHVWEFYLVWIEVKIQEHMWSHYANCKQLFPPAVYSGLCTYAIWRYTLFWHYTIKTIMCLFV